MKTSIGYNINYKPETSEENDPNCPHHGTISVRGKTFEGVVISDSMDKTVKVAWENLEKKTQNIQDILRKKSKVAAHNPVCISAKKGDKVLIGETKPISKTKHFVVLKVIKE